MTIKTCETVQIPPPEDDSTDGSDEGGTEEPQEPEEPSDGGGRMSRKVLAIGGATGLGILGYMRRKND